MHEVIVCEKPKASEKIAAAIPGSAVKKSYKRVPYYEIQQGDKKTTVLSAVGHLYSLSPLKKKKVVCLKWTGYHYMKKIKAKNM